MKRIAHKGSTAPQGWELKSINVNKFKSQLDYKLTDDDLFYVDNSRALWHKNPTSEIYWICIPPKDYQHSNCGEVGKPLPLNSKSLNESVLSKIIVCGD
jgi:hypothetical protein